MQISLTVLDLCHHRNMPCHLDLCINGNMTEADFIGKDPFADIMVINFHMSCVSMKNQIEYK